MSPTPQFYLHRMLGANDSSTCIVCLSVWLTFLFHIWSIFGVWSYIRVQGGQWEQGEAIQLKNRRPLYPLLTSWPRGAVLSHASSLMKWGLTRQRNLKWKEEEEFEEFLGLTLFLQVGWEAAARALTLRGGLYSKGTPLQEEWGRRAATTPGPPPPQRGKTLSLWFRCHRTRLCRKCKLGSVAHIFHTQLELGSK